MNEEIKYTLSFDCPYCGYQYKLSGLKMMDRRVKCGNCESKFSVRSEMATVAVVKKKMRRDTVTDMF
ncbi:MAG: hypothetical protein NE328_08930 [Lentisphaeraceae bacterium]|nr:hypothetical protein [Lentisphaeraceae bacterium]